MYYVNDRWAGEKAILIMRIEQYLERMMMRLR
jgi:hypothetical protein